MNPSVIEELKRIKDDLEIQKIVSERDKVLGRFGPQFLPSAVAKLEEKTFRQFLSIKHNKHWTGLERQPEVYADMNRLREALSVLVDETRPIRDRVNMVVEVPGMGVAKFSAILHVAYPNKYGVWNGTSEKAIRHLGLWPVISRGATTTGDKYVAVNQLLRDLADRLGSDLWTLDALWWALDLGGTSVANSTGTGKVRFGDRWEKAVADMKYSILNTVKNSNGQAVATTVKKKDLKMSESELERLLSDLLESQDKRCAITGIPFQYDDDRNMRPSADRIDSNGHYEASNLQLVCQFINFWKQACPDDEFRHLIQIVRDSKGAEPSG
ncbi:hypothetical protein SAMN05444004_12333 [Jannaschia faecimaris]|uniref:Uncharacterized protein n=1 Tax=Jannaschia faecimaris TaxID=1244108 RepID=A0A1H3U4X4_9RHOB|nr:hypothetical protein SAMN05444004_12333 [Jannaschia faecimaris]